MFHAIADPARSGGKFAQHPATLVQATEWLRWTHRILVMAQLSEGSFCHQTNLIGNAPGPPPPMAPWGERS